MISFTKIGIFKLKADFLAFADEKNGVSKDTHLTSIPWLRKRRAETILSRPPELKPKAQTFFVDMVIMFSNRSRLSVENETVFNVHFIT